MELRRLILSAVICGLMLGCQTENDEGTAVDSDGPPTNPNEMDKDTSVTNDTNVADTNSLGNSEDTENEEKSRSQHQHGEMVLTA